MKHKAKIYVTKASGQSAEYSENKLRESLTRAGVGNDQITAILSQVSAKLYQGISTKKIYRIAFNLLKQDAGHVAAKYHLKPAIMELGPSGFPFETFFAEILKYQGYKTKVDELVDGRCVKHEIDVIAQKEELYCMIECKYHNLPGRVCDVKVPLYIRGRFEDVEAAWLSMPEHKTKHHQGWVVTNTKFTGDALQYGTCAGLKLVGWDYPKGNGLRNQIDSLGLYPITCLTTLAKHEKQMLLDRRIVLCKEICRNPGILHKIGINQPRENAVLDEATKLCGHLTEQKEVYHESSGV